MAKLPKITSEAWNNRKGAIVLTTVSENGLANSIYATCVRKYNEETIVVADNYFDKTRKNIFSGCKGVVLFITKDDNAYQIKGSIDYLTKGALFDDMKKWNPKEHPGNAAVIIKVEEVYEGSKKLL